MSATSLALMLQAQEADVSEGGLCPPRTAAALEQRSSGEAGEELLCRDKPGHLRRSGDGTLLEGADHPVTVGCDPGLIIFLVCQVRLVVRQCDLFGGLLVHPVRNHLL